MGYDLHITRRRDWQDKGKDITADEWRRHAAEDPRLEWLEGRIDAKNPDQVLVTKMVAIARELGATVQGDDGEIYGEDLHSPRKPAASLGQRLANWFARLRAQRPLDIAHQPLSFGVGDKVRDSWGRTHTVITIDAKAVHGLGVIVTRREDGKELRHAMNAHGLSPLK